MLKPYVYALIDPRDGSVFYIGKGTGRRMYQHEQEVKRGKIDNAEKARAIFSILAAGFRVVCRVLQVCATDKQAYEAEKQHIAAHQGLTNLTAGGGGIASGTPRNELDRELAKTNTMIASIRPFREWRARVNPDQGAITMYAWVLVQLNQVKAALEAALEVKHGRVTQ